MFRLLMFVISFFVCVPSWRVFAIEPSNSEFRQNEQRMAVRKAAWEQQLKKHRFQFLDGSHGVFASLPQFKDDSELHIVYRSSEPERLTLQVFDQGKRVLSILCHPDTSFAAGNNRLFVTEYQTDFMGCTVVAYDLTSGKEIWRTKLHQAQPGGASAYRNRVKISYREKGVDPNAPNETAVFVKGNETYVDYIEVLDAETGKSLAIKNYRVGFGSQASGGGNAEEARKKRAAEEAEDQETTEPR